jgi:DNA-directed RNA polymerase specialized sigma24 family protein
MTTTEEGPDPCDIEAWRLAIKSQSLAKVHSFRLVIAVQTIGPSGDQRVLNGLMTEISARMMRILRKHIGRNHRNEGRDLIEAAHDTLIRAVLRPKSADGKALRTAFVARVRFRAADAIRSEMKHNERYDYALDEGSLPDRHKKTEPTAEGHAHVESVLRQIADPRKRLAFRLYMDGVQRGSKKPESIATALDVSVKTAETWIRQIKEQLKTIPGVTS